MLQNSISQTQFDEQTIVPYQVVAVFDFDNTITWRDSLAPFLIYLVGIKKTYWNFFLLLPFFIGFLVGIVPRQKVKEKILTRFIKGMPIAELEEKGKIYAENLLNDLVNPKAIERLRWHQSQGHCCIISSASLDVYLAPWAESKGFKFLMCSKLEVKEGRVTGKLEGSNCWGPEKRRRLIKLLGPVKSYELYMYGDSRGDKELLEIADYPYYRKLA